jgi:hypothetical protein
MYTHKVTKWASRKVCTDWFSDLAARVAVSLLTFIIVYTASMSPIVEVHCCYFEFGGPWQPLVRVYFPSPVKNLKVKLYRNTIISTGIVFSSFSLFWKNKSRFMRSPSCLSSPVRVIDSEDGGSTFLRNGCKFLPDYTASRPRRWYSS